MDDRGEITFRQIQSRVVHDMLILRHDRVIVRLGSGEEIDERHIPLDDIDSEIEITNRRSFVASCSLIVIGIAIAATIPKVNGRDWQGSLLAIGFAFLSMIVLTAGIDAGCSVPIAKVKSRSGEVLFQLMRQPDVAADFEVFLLQLQRRIKARNGA